MSWSPHLAQINIHLRVQARVHCSYLYYFKILAGKKEHYLVQGRLPEQSSEICVCVILWRSQDVNHNVFSKCFYFIVGSYA